MDLVIEPPGEAAPGLKLGVRFPHWGGGSFGYSLPEQMPRALKLGGGFFGPGGGFLNHTRGLSAYVSVQKHPLIGDLAPAT